MSNQLSSKGSLAYQGTNATMPPNMFVINRAPTPTDYQGFQLGDFWLYRLSLTSNNSNLYTLLGKSNNVANWVLISGNVGPIEGLTGNSGGEVMPDINQNINVLGDGTSINVVGNPGTNTLTISAMADIATSYATDSGTAVPAAGVLTIHGAGGLSTSGSGSTVTITGIGGGIVWNDVITPTANMAINNGYVAHDAASLVTLTLPAAAAFGTELYVSGLSSMGWVIAQNALQSINFGSHATMVGTGGSLASTNPYDSVGLVCVVANTTWNVINSVGNLTVT